MKNQKITISVIGGHDIDGDVESLAHGIGEIIAKVGAVLVCGGLTGAMEQAAKGARDAGGTVIERRLNNEILKIDTGCIVAYTPGIDFDIEAAGGLRSMVFGGEGIFLATLRGTGTVWLQSMPIRKLIQAISPYGKNVRKESRSLLNNFLEP